MPLEEKTPSVPKSNQPKTLAWAVFLQDETDVLKESFLFVSARAPRLRGVVVVVPPLHGALVNTFTG